MKVKLSDLRLGYAVRAERISLDHVAALIEVGPKAWPPIMVQAGTMKVIDGNHRRAAATRMKLETIDATVCEVGDAAALAMAAEANIAHGLPLSVAERRSVAKRLVADTTWGDRRIGEMCGLSHDTVSKLRPRPTGDSGQLDTRTTVPKRTGADGIDRPATAADAAAGRARAAGIVSENPDIPVRQLADAAGISKSTAATVKKEPERHLAAVPTVSDAPDADPVEPTVGDLVVLAPTHWAADERCQLSDATREFGRFMDRFTRWNDRYFGEWIEMALQDCPADLRTEAQDMAKSMAAGWNRIANEITTTTMGAVQ